MAPNFNYIAPIKAIALRPLPYLTPTVAAVFKFLNNQCYFPPFLGRSATESTIVEATTGLLYQPRMRVWSSRWNVGRGNRSTRRKPASSATLSTTNPTWPDCDANSGRRGGKPATNHWTTAQPAGMLPELCTLQLVQLLRLRGCLWVSLVKQCALKTYGGLEVQLQPSWPRHWKETIGQIHSPPLYSPYHIGQEADWGHRAHLRHV
jgi:hypothetical protein